MWFCGSFCDGIEYRLMDTRGRALLSAYADGPLPSIANLRHAVQQNCNKFQQKVSKRYWYLPILKTTCYNPIFDSQIYQNTAESLILPGFFSGAFSFYYIVFFLNQIWMIDFYDFSRDCLLSFWISFIFLLVRNS